MTSDLFVGFEEEPKGLEEFMKQQGYTSIQRKKDDSGGYLTFERLENPWPCVYYSTHTKKVKDPEDVPNWRRAGFRVVSDVDINYPYRDNYWEEALRLAEDLAEKFKGILYDPNMDEYSRY